jgi:hypothetical protein
MECLQTDEHAGTASAAMNAFAFECDPRGSGRWQLIEAASSRQLGVAMAAGKAKVGMTVCGKEYEYDLTTMMQTNILTKVERKLRMVAPMSVSYEIEGDPIGSGKWGACKDDVCIKLAKAHAEGTKRLTYSWAMHKYSYDLCALTQTNVSTNVVRQLRVSRCRAVWAFEDGTAGSNKWILYDDASCDALCKAFATAGSSTLRLVVGAHTYEIDLDAMVQTNVGTSQQRAMRIVSLCGSAAAAETDDDAESDGSGITEHNPPVGCAKPCCGYPSLLQCAT